MKVSCCRGRPALLISILLASCQPLPHPFADDRPPASLLTVRDSAGISVQTIEGGPPATAQKLGAAIASALGKRDIPASDRTTSLGSYLLNGRIERARSRDGKVTVTAHWRLQNAAGQPVGERTAQLDAAPREWDKGDDQVVARLATASARRQPPWAAPITPASASANNTGAQSAASTPSAIPGTFVTVPSARGLSSRRHGRSTVMTVVPWIW